MCKLDYLKQKIEDETPKTRSGNLRAQFHHLYVFALDVSRVTSRDRLKCFDVLTRNSIHVLHPRVQGKVTIVKIATA